MLWDGAARRFAWFVVRFAIAGQALGVMALLVVLSVMNGFGAEIVRRLERALPDATLLYPAPVRDWHSMARAIEQSPGIAAVSPQLEETVMLGNGRLRHSVRLLALDMERDSAIVDLPALLAQGSTAGLVLGRDSAMQLRLELGDEVEMILPRLQATPLGLFARRVRLRLAGIFVSDSQLDNRLAFVPLAEGMRLLGSSGVDGLRIAATADARSGAVAAAVAAHLGPGHHLRPWQEPFGALMAALRLEKLACALMLGLIILVAAFNSLSGMLMMVADRRETIAVLRTLGMSRAAVGALFMSQGLVLGGLGIALGAALGGLVVANFDSLMAALDALRGRPLFAPEVYYINTVPSQWRTGDLALVVCAAATLALLASLWPARRAAAIRPAEALRYS